LAAVDAATRQRLTEGANELGAALSAEQIDRFDEYLALLQEWNRRINLTAISDPAAVVGLHFLDSLAAVPLVRDCKTLIDVGAGAGFPGAVLAIALPSLRVTCIEAVAKKVAFLQALKRKLTLNLEALHLRDEQIDRTFDAAISRATWAPAEWVERGTRLVSPGGLLIAMQTADASKLTTPSCFLKLEPVEYAVGNARRRLQPFRRNVPRGTHKYR
jgi:16S rRNA (guanine527-N7)-methyltransferase